MADSRTTEPNPILAGLACRCPRCGKGKMFSGFLGLKPRCEACGLDYSFIDAGDGPAVFVILFAGFMVVGAALVAHEGRPVAVQMCPAVGGFAVLVAGHDELGVVLLVPARRQPDAHRQLHPADHPAQR